MHRMIFVATILIAVGGACWPSPAPAVTITPPSCNTAPCPVAYVSMNGYSITNNGANACVMPSATQPVGCNTFVDALNSVTAGGTIVILDDYEYSQTIVVTKSVAIVSPSHATIAPPSGDPAVSIATAGAVVDLDGLILDGQSGGTAGVSATNAAALRIKNVRVKNFTGGGIVAGIDIKPASGVTIDANIENSEIESNTYGIVADGTSGGAIHGTVSNSVVLDNTEDGIAAISSGSSAWLLIDETKVSGNAFGLAAGGTGAEILARNSSVFGNSTGLHTSGAGVLYSYGNNSVNGNTTNGAFTGTVGLQ